MTNAQSPIGRTITPGLLERRILSRNGRLACGLALPLAFGWLSPCHAEPLDIAGIDPAPAGSAPLLSAAPGVTAIAGRVLAIDDKPLAGVAVSDGAAHASTDAQGRFLLSGVPAGESIVVLDGRHAGPAGGDYGYYEMRVPAQALRTTQLPYVNWLTPIDHGHDVAIAEPLARPVVVTTPAIPDLELRIPAGAVITDPDHKPVTRVGLTKISTRRPPFPLPRNVKVPVYFTAQPGGSVISSADGSWLGAQVVYPNYYHQLPRAQESFWRYDPDQGGWSVYGAGTVTNDGRQVVPDKKTRIYSLSGAMISGGPAPCTQRGICPTPIRDPTGGEPVDLETGAFIQDREDQSVADVLPIHVSRSYNSSDTTKHAFGAGMSSAYDITLWSDDNYQTASLVLPGYRSIPYTVVQGGTGLYLPWQSAVYTTTTPGPWFNSTIAWNFPGDDWVLTRSDGVKLFFGTFAPLQAIEDRFGNKITITRDGNQNVTQVTSPNGKFITFAISNNVVTSATDNLGRTFTYTYDPNWTMLQTVTDPDGGVTTYSWNNGQVTSIKDPRGKVFITNSYDSNLRVHQQTLADQSSTYSFAYTLGSISATVGSLTEYNVVQTTVTDPNAHNRTLTFDNAGYVLTDNSAVGTAVEVDRTYCRSGDTNPSACPAISGVPSEYVADVLDGLFVDSNGLAVTSGGASRDTHYSYDANANVLGVTYLYGTSAAAAYSFTYSPTFNLPTSTTDPLGHTTSITRPEPLEEATAVTDALGHSWNFAYNAQGQVQTVTDALTPANTTTLTYDHGDLASVTDPLGRTSPLYTDAIGRPIRVADPLGNTWKSVWDPLDGVHQATDPNGASTMISYDQDGNVSNVVDALSHTTAYTYTSRDQLLTRTDPKAYQDQFTSYDPNGNLLIAIDRKNQTATYTYDALNRLSTATYADGSVVSYSWDNGSRLTQVSDTAGNTIHRFYDGLDNLLCETSQSLTTLSACQSAASQSTAANAVAYSYDTVSRRQTMTVNGQAAITYTWDNADRLTNISQAAYNSQAAAQVIKTYDNDNRPATLTLPNSVVGTYSFDAASELTEISYAKGSTSVGTLIYTYDADGRVSSRSGTLFQSVMPAAAAGIVYDADNRLCAWNAASPSCTAPTITWDNNGNLTNDGSHTYTWDSRNRLKATSNRSAAYTYDALGRRLTNKFGPTTTSYLYDFANVVQEQVAGTASANLLTGLEVDERFQRAIVGAGTTSPLTDAIGSELALSTSSQTGGSSTSYAYDPYGNTTASGGGNSNPYQFTGRENDGTGLYYYRARYYNPTWGRFISEDPIGFLGGINKYAYASGDPLDYTDPSGTQIVIPGPFIYLPPLIMGLWCEITNCTGGMGPHGGTAYPTAPGTVADTQIVQDYNNYASSQRLCGQPPLDRCDWLSQNAQNYRRDQVIATEKAWGCRRSRARG